MHMDISRIVFQQKYLPPHTLVRLWESENPTALQAELSHPEIIRFIKTIIFQNLHSLNVAEKKLSVFVEPKDLL